MSMPLVLMKAIIMLRKPLTAEPLQHRQVRDADVKSVTAVAAVCRHWHRIISRSNGGSRRLLRQLFHGL